jgi:hypothetical protein
VDEVVEVEEAVVVAQEEVVVVVAVVSGAGCGTRINIM